LSPHPRPLSRAGRGEDGSLAGSRILLRHVVTDDLPAIESWLPEAAATVRGVREPEETDFATALGLIRMTDDGSEALVIARADGAEPIGLLVYGLPADGWLEFRFLALAKGLRGWGYGSEAVMLIEESGRAQRFAAEVYSGNGLGLFFWLRMGYRLAVPGELPWREREPEDKIAMVRERKE